MQPTREGLHVAIIMDGNGRWAQARRLPRTAGHRAGARAVDRVIRAAPGLGVASLTLFAFSADNWKRPPEEVQALLRLLGEYLASKTSECVRNGVRLRVIGRRDRLPAELVDAIAESEAATREGTRLLFTPRMWPEFDGEALRAAIEEFRARQRNFGDIPRSDAG